MRLSYKKILIKIYILDKSNQIKVIYLKKSLFHKLRETV